MTTPSQPTPQSDSELLEIVERIRRGRMLDEGSKVPADEAGIDRDKAEQLLLQWADRRAEKLVVEADDKAHLIGFKNGKWAMTKRMNDLWFTLMIDEVGYKKASAYRDAVNAALTAIKEERV